MKYKYEIEFDISKFSEDELQEIYNDICHWRWSPLLGEKPDWWDDSPDYLTGRFKNIRERYIPTKDRATQHIFEQIQMHVGQYKLLEYHWTHNLGRTKEEYREWALAKCVDTYSMKEK